MMRPAGKVFYTLRASVQDSHAGAAPASSSEDGWLSPIAAGNADLDGLR